jgi:short-subunit dehydrogenase
VLAQEQHLDLWINNAGIAGLGGFRELPISSFDHVINVNLHGLAYGTYLALETMESQGSGTIVNIASVAGHVPAPYMAAYVASKHAVVGFTRSVRRELKFGDSAVKMVLVSPGFVKTDMIQNHASLKFPEWLQWSLSTPDAVAKAIIKGIRAGKEELTPTLNGQFMRRLHQVLPEATERSSKLILAGSLKDAFLNRFDR